MAQLLQRFRELRPPGTSDALSVARLSSRSGVWVGQDSTGRPLVLIEAAGSDARIHGVVLRNITFEPWLTCRIIEKGKAAREIGASVIRCTAIERELHEHFLRALSPSCEDLRSQPQVAEVALVVEKLIEVFQALSQPARESLQGLWAELLLISRAQDIELATEAWQRRAHSLIDFEHDQCGVEVKSTSNAVRQHRFKLAQLQPVVGHRRFIASLVLLSDARGASIGELWEVIERRLRHRPLLRDKVAARIAQTLGDDWHRAHSQRFSLPAAVDSILVFDVVNVPRVGEGSPPCILDVEFTVDFSGVSPVVRSTLAAQGPLLASLLAQSPAIPAHAP
jgi:hypothetical protein